MGTQTSIPNTPVAFRVFGPGYRKQGCLVAVRWVRHLLEGSDTFSKDASNVTVKTFTMLQKISISNQCCHLNFPFTNKCLKNGIKPFSTLLMIRKVSWAANHHIRMISEGSRNTVYWSNDAENSALITGRNDVWKYIQIGNMYLKFL